MHHKNFHTCSSDDSKIVIPRYFCLWNVVLFPCKCFKKDVVSVSFIPQKLYLESFLQKFHIQFQTLLFFLFSHLLFFPKKSVPMLLGESFPNSVSALAPYSLFSPMSFFILRFDINVTTLFRCMISIATLNQNFRFLCRRSLSSFSVASKKFFSQVCELEAYCFSYCIWKGCIYFFEFLVNVGKVLVLFHQKISTLILQNRPSQLPLLLQE